MPAKRPPFQRLYLKMRVNEAGCWEWMGQTQESGYGQIKAFGKLVNCHRLSYELYHGPIPGGLEVTHTCDNRVCVNPDHLVAGTHQQNMADMILKGRRVQGQPNPLKGKDNPKSQPVRVLGSIFGSMKEAERSLGLGHGTVRYWIKNHPAKAEQLNKEDVHGQ